MKDQERYEESDLSPLFDEWVVEVYHSLNDFAFEYLVLISLSQLHKEILA